ncbi:hypothetical protein [Alkalihalobacillus sp. TS-13]|uniref:hypothetical protein n=1 Tax=Alkalihalobacillus sp. TS-13 TaxID=2842455 RepID=UPI001C8673F7|nr:hypothetical protein [Alkalihalobacillus sp. TS-13]
MGCGLTTTDDAHTAENGIITAKSGASTAEIATDTAKPNERVLTPYGIGVST